MGKMENAYTTFVKKIIRRSRHRWEYNIITNLQETGWDWIHLAYSRDCWWDLTNTVMNLQVPYKAENFLIC